MALLEFDIGVIIIVKLHQYEIALLYSYTHREIIINVIIKTRQVYFTLIKDSNKTKYDQIQFHNTGLNYTAKTEVNHFGSATTWAVY